MPVPRRLVCLALLLSPASHALAAEPGAPEDSLDPTCGHVFSGAAARTLASALIPAEELGAVWDPTPAEITLLEGILAQELKKRVAARASPLHVRDYYRQYAGAHRQGRRLIVINGFHRSYVEQERAWLSEPRTEAELERFPVEARGKDFWHFVPVGVLDGGEHFFEAFYDPVRRRMAVFRFHGFA
jgi:hypothetical protein